MDPGLKRRGLDDLELTATRAAGGHRPREYLPHRETSPVPILVTAFYSQPNQITKRGTQNTVGISATEVTVLPAKQMMAHLGLVAPKFAQHWHPVSVGG